MRTLRQKVRQALVWGGISLILGGFFLYHLRNARENARSSQCISNLKQLGLALHNYQTAYGCLPPDCVVDREGKPLYSWRVVLMAFLERTEKWNDWQLTRSFHFDEPWDSPANSKLHGIRPANYFCPSDPESEGKGYTCFVAVVGPRTLFPGGGLSRRPEEIRDDLAKTLMLVETANARIHWMEPRDLEWDRMSFKVDDSSAPCISSPHQIGSYREPHVLTADQGVSRLNGSVLPDVVRGLLTIDGGEKAELHPQEPQK